MSKSVNILPHFDMPILKWQPFRMAKYWYHFMLALQNLCA